MWPALTIFIKSKNGQLGRWQSDREAGSLTTASRQTGLGSRRWAIHLVPGGPEPWALAVLTVAPFPVLWSSVTPLAKSGGTAPTHSLGGKLSPEICWGNVTLNLSLDSWLSALPADPGSAPQTSLERIHAWAENFSPSEKPLTSQMPLTCQSEGPAYHLSHFSPRLAA